MNEYDFSLSLIWWWELRCISHKYFSLKFWRIYFCVHTYCSITETYSGKYISILLFFRITKNGKISRQFMEKIIILNWQKSVIYTFTFLHGGRRRYIVLECIKSITIRSEFQCSFKVIRKCLNISFNALFQYRAVWNWCGRKENYSLEWMQHLCGILF